MDEVVPGSVEYWLLRLARELDERRDRLRVYQDYYAGNHPLAFASSKFQRAFGGLFDEFADNWCDLVVDAVEERLNVEGFRFGEDTEGDTRAWSIWQRNLLDADSQLAHQEALINGMSYALVWGGEDDLAEITVEHPNEVIVARAPGNRRRRLAALKKWVDEEGYENATVYLPDGIYKFRSVRKVKSIDLARSYRLEEWEAKEVAAEPWPVPNPLGVVPVVPLLNKPQLLVDGTSELHKVIPLQDAVNKLVADMLVASEFSAFRQRWATGMDIPRDPETGAALEPFKHAIDRLWIATSSDTTFGEFSESSLANYVTAIETLVQHVASQTRTPPHYFYLSGQFPSGESIKSAETGLVAKAYRRMRHFGEAWEEVIRLAFTVEGDLERGAFWAAETIWRDPESRSEGEHIDAVLKKQALGVPVEQLWSDAGYSPQQIARFKEIQRQAMLDADSVALDALVRFDADRRPNLPADEPAL